MDNNKVLSNIKHILNNSTEKVSIFVDGNWGIGKTFLIKNQLFDKEKNEYDFKYVSVFGRNNLKEIENELLMQFLPKIEIINKAGKTGRKVIKDLSKKFIGIDINEYINCFSINNIPSKFLNAKKTIICFDDIERKADEVKLKNLLGLIERSSQQFDVIVISNSSKFEKEDMELFNHYKEKILDYEFCITSINDDIFRKILRNRRNKQDIEYENRIIKIYTENAYKWCSQGSDKYKKESINNIRIYIKFIDLLYRVENEVLKLINYNKLDDIFIKACKHVVYDYYNKGKKNNNDKHKFDNQVIAREIKKIFLYEDYDFNNIKEYLEQNLEIRKDILMIWNLYKLNENDFELLIKKICEKINDKNTEYFFSQKQVISMLDAFSHLNIADSYEEKLFLIAKELYKPTLSTSPNVYNEGNWFEVNQLNEITYNDKTKTFIQKINTSNKIKFNKYVNKQYEEAIAEKNIRKLKKVLEYKKIDDLKEFERIFSFAFNYLISNYDNEYVSFIELLIKNTQSGIILKYFTEKAKKETKMTIKKKYEYFNEILTRKKYSEDEQNNNQ